MRHGNERACAQERRWEMDLYGVGNTKPVAPKSRGRDGGHSAREGGEGRGGSDGDLDGKLGWKRLDDGDWCPPRKISFPYKYLSPVKARTLLLFSLSSRTDLASCQCQAAAFILVLPRVLPAIRLSSSQRAAELTLLQPALPLPRPRLLPLTCMP